MSDSRKKDVVWEIVDLGGGGVTPQDAALAVLMDIRDELKRINVRLDCSETKSIPENLRLIRRNTTKRRRKRR